MPQMSEKQAGFVPGDGTRVKILMETAREFNLPLFLCCFVDYGRLI